MKIFRNGLNKKWRLLGLALTLIFGLIAVVASGGDGGGDDGNSDNGSNTQYNLTGDWAGTMESKLVSGACPSNPPDQQGTVTISQSGETFTLTFGNGFSCSPASACVFTDGVISNATYTISNTGVADDEGGKYANTLALTALSTNLVKGTGTSSYINGGFECHWTTTLTLTR
ncbi:MAG: hypothetical protein DSY90_01955 [Deltaproteobacteria bacterium]|nr:MAG: hypothetical protein DSY90_01955 [Deltaproteobacteria bacterium]